MFAQFLAEMLQVIGGLIVIYFVYIFLTKKNDKPATNTPSMAHAALRELVERAVDEAHKLPGLGDSMSTKTQENSSVAGQNYEDLLANAILNKVIEKYQNESVDGNSNVLYGKSTRKCKHMRNLCEIEPNEEISSLDSSEACCSSCSELKKDHRNLSNPLSLTIEEQIEEVTTLYTSDEESGFIKADIFNFHNARRVPFPEFGMDIVDPSQGSSEESEDEFDGAAKIDHITPVESWEENWLFQKKKIPIQSEAVAMLVPNPSADYRALIGDKDADDTSDLSEFSTLSDQEIEEDIIEAINPVVPESSNTKENISTFSAHKNEKKLTISHDQEKKLTNESTIHFHFSYGLNKKTNSTTEIKINDEIQSNENNEANHLINIALHDDKENVITPKTPTPSPVRNSFNENDSVNFEKLSEKLIKSIEEETTNFSQQKNQLENLLNNEKTKLKSLIQRELTENTEKNIEVLENNSDRECREAAANAKAQSVMLNPQKIHDNDDPELSGPPRPGTIAEREHKKWQNAAPIQNNPYSEQSIQKRLWERQYSRRPSDVTGNSTVLPTSPSSPLQIVLGANRPDIKRFSRDYYINESKSPTGEKPGHSGISLSSRPSSSLSQHSNSMSSDFEHQDNFGDIEATSKSLEITQNNEILERERKNSKNSINAKLNNQGNFDNIVTIFDPSMKPFADDNQRKIRRIDLKAYGFENEFSNNDMKNTKQRRIPNKLDLRSFGYDSGLRRTQSNNNLDSKVHNSFLNSKTIREKIDSKSNLSQNYREGASDFNWTNSSEALNREKFFPKFNGMTSAKSVPNIEKSASYFYNGNKIVSSESDDDEKHFISRINRENEESYQVENSQNHSMMQLIDEETQNSTNDGQNYETNSQSSQTESTDGLNQKLSTLKEFKYSLESSEGSGTFIDRKLPMPSVRKLAETFNKPLRPTTTQINSKISKLNHETNKDRPVTPEIHIIDTPRQMHSLTARSLSREFREGLKQMSNKPVIEQIKKTMEIEKKSSDYENTETIDVIPPGKLKNNIQFWEQLQKKN